MGPIETRFSIAVSDLPGNFRFIESLLHKTGNDGGGRRFGVPFCRRSLNLRATPSEAVDNEEDQIGRGYGTAENEGRKLVLFVKG
jgi:hypothetical protein